MLYFAVQNSLNYYFQVIQYDIDGPIILLSEDSPGVAIEYLSLFLDFMEVKTVVVGAFSSF